MAEGKRLTRSQSVAIALRNFTATSLEVEDVLELIDAEDQRHPLDGPDHPAQPLDHPARGVGVGAGDDAPEQSPVARGEVLAPQVLEHPRLDPGIVALEVEQGLHQVDVDVAEPLVEEDAVGHVADDPVDRLLIEVPLAKLLEPLAARLAERLGQGGRRAGSGRSAATRARSTACRATRSGCSGRIGRTRR